jgi:hypothetical protein
VLKRYIHEHVASVWSCDDINNVDVSAREPSSPSSQHLPTINSPIFSYRLHFTPISHPSTIPSAPNQFKHQTNTFKMQFTTILASSILAFSAGISAAPTSAPNVTLRIFNDQTGINSDATVPADNVARDITTLFQGTPIGNAGFIGTSAQLTQFSDTTKCQLANKNVPGWVIQLDGRAKNFVDLDGDVTKAIPVSIGGFTFACSPA